MIRTTVPKSNASLRWRSVAVKVTGPAGILPIGIFVAVLVGFFIYTPPEASLKPESMLFFQGSTDLGGGCLFAGTMALYLVFGFMGGVYLTTRLDEQPARGFLLDFACALRILKWHILAFVIGGTFNISYDGWVRENDFRNMFVLATVLYGLSMGLTVWLRQTHVSFRWRVVLSPALICLWMIMGADGTTPRAGQLVNSGEDPVVKARGVRHAMMLRWHRVCDAALGDIIGDP